MRTLLSAILLIVGGTFLLLFVLPVEFTREMIERRRNRNEIRKRMFRS